MNDQHFKAIVNEQFDIDLNSIGGLDIVSVGPKQFHILKDHKAFLAELVTHDAVTRQFEIKINGNLYQIRLEDQYDQLVKKLGLTTKKTHKVKDIKAPMPGLVLSIQVEVGQTVQKGDPLLILEAMKMENVLKSPGEGTVKTIHAQQGAAVEKGYLLIEMA
ncbi:MAG TPA: acetyl-CoA carboxylase biotin carboxyl carrier protein subunit [Saprospiraceae bacterium]|nr:acetyl-CoA carboxylase biotin carboxyl carrier protein subunit [Saprospiraceae bacterium]HMP12698.1 acetyl-CoA carboxylase biotin carboxyl carrier protein subunit [Saprospiraceae bacterium]